MAHGRPAGSRWSPLALLVLFLAAGPGSGLAQVPANAPQSPIGGAAVYGSRGCVACHSISGIGGSVGPDLRASTSTRDAVGIVAALWNHLPSMADRMRSLEIARPRLSARETGDLIAFLFAIGESHGEGSADAGREAFRARGCIRCHQVEGTGGVIGPALDRLPSLRTPHGLAAGLWNHAGGMIPRMRSMGLEYPRLTASDIADLTALLAAAGPSTAAQSAAPQWVLPGDPGRGSLVVDEKGCRNCHTVDGRGAGSAPELVRGGERRTTEAFLAALWNKGPRMRAAFEARGEEPPRFEPGEMADLSAFLQSFEYFAGAGDAGRGTAIVRSEGCLSCHGWGGAGPSAGDLRSTPARPEFADRAAALWNHVSLGPVAGYPPERWPTLTRQQMADVLAFLGSGSR